jgi:hypothetical protein
MMNGTTPPTKRSTVERQIDDVILFMFLLLFAMCGFGAFLTAVWTQSLGDKMWYLMPWDTVSFFSADQPLVVAMGHFITTFILYGFLIPISLYVSIEMVKLCQVYFIGRDLAMYYAPLSMRAQCRTSNLNEELGMVNTVLSDKTGTLTRNQMELFKVSIAGVSYGQGMTEVERSAMRRNGRVPPPEVRHSAMQKLANRKTVGISGGGSIAHAAVSRRPPISLHTIAARTRMYSYAAKVWDSSIVQGPIPRAKPHRYDSPPLASLNEMRIKPGSAEWGGPYATPTAAPTTASLGSRCRPVRPNLRVTIRNCLRRCRCRRPSRSSTSTTSGSRPAAASARWTRAPSTTSCGCWRSATRRCRRASRRRRASRTRRRARTSWRSSLR